MTNPNPHSRRLLQFSLRTLLLAMLLVAVFLGGRESGRRTLEAESRHAESERQKAEAARKKAKLAFLQAQLELQERRFRIAEERLGQQLWEQDYREFKRLLQLSEQQGVGRNGKWSSAEVPTFEPATVEQSPRGGVHINEYWQRKERTRRFSSSPRILDPWSANS